MAVQHIIDALVADWDRVTDLLGTDGRNRLRKLIDALRDAQSADGRAAVATRITRVLGDFLPHDDPVFADAGVRYSNPGQVHELDKLLVSISGDPRLYGRPRSAEERILTHARESAAALRERGHMPDAFGVIQFHFDNGSASVPLFQFDESGAPLEVVLRVNWLLRAHEDPWGAADWWFSANAWLTEPPYELIGRTPDDLLVAAAVALTEG
ncbi:hypothetical protein ACIRG5_02225 [Lentzea sp. NPDC102401]|uniref:hypothetical protein n=1 Tax=Lentzea sp. NPDC102401 TaxID=3364128 RepID=UPI003809BB62